VDDTIVFVRLNWSSGGPANLHQKQWQQQTPRQRQQQQLLVAYTTVEAPVGQQLLRTGLGVDGGVSRPQIADEQMREVCFHAFFARDIISLFYDNYKLYDFF
jgi:hypothetical protein